ncbi:synapse differentiation-inducing gene protein 1-like [Zootoca vivipara]|uniref:synapse differentiation-inducing gene protein 1-like n=1 Tax=Zootoca vivipara TaxID=8524 RepID=UPI0015903DE5|nr:synapse differentiation-inducing gene protein 1-like [Zootoca vivipara]
MSNEKPPILPSGEEPAQVFDPLMPPAGPAPPMDYGVPPTGYGAPAPFQPPYAVYYSPPGAGSTEDPILQPPQTITITPVQPCNEPDHLGYSIFTMLCCCLPLGIAALVYSIQTRNANLMGRTIVAKQKSRRALNFAHSAVCVGIVFIILNIIRLVVCRDKY